ncbi:MAG TPA: bifunctional diguanylate cyclase/phosphodiesterase [Pseudonocardia sp.]|nr:bifunctional diguanylate cyclase/phosphodiesterase [Pseudonocardia sp.]
MVLVLLAVSVFAVVGSQVTAAASAEAVAASSVSEDYWRAATAVGAVESLERKYRLEPGPAVRAAFDRSSAALTSALAEVERDGDVADRAVVELVTEQHGVFLEANGRLFDAIDRGDGVEALRIDAEETEPPFAVMEAAVLDAAAESHDQALAALRGLQDVESVIRVLTPVVFLVGLLLAGLLASITREHRRLLELERERAVHDAHHDALTGLPNRILFAERVEQALGARAGTDAGVALLLVDLDRFKEINDTFGHRCGDQLIVQVGARLREVAQGAGTVARLGGDEFAVLLPEVESVQGAVETAGALRGALISPFPVDGVDLDVEASVGVAVSGHHGQDAVTLLQRADIAMYVAKDQGRGIFVYDREADRHSPAKLAVLGDLRRALDRGELVLHYQPKVSVGSGEVVGVEALVRWHHPQRGLVLPGAFMPFAEHTGLIGPLTRHILDEALAQARAWCAQGRPRCVAVNLSARCLLDERLPDQVGELLAAHGVAADLLVLEVTESAVVTEPKRAQELLGRLSSLGVRISIDDFGAGYTSLSQLKTLPVSELKIDRSFVTTMTEDTRNALIVQSVIELGHNLGLSIVAEGVEDERTLTALAALHCDIAQGYHLDRPMAAALLDAREPAPHGVPGTGSRSRPEAWD